MQNRYKKLLDKVKGTKLTIHSQLDLFMEYTNIYSDLTQSSIPSKKKQELSQKLKEIYKKLKEYGK